MHDPVSRQPFDLEGPDPWRTLGSTLVLDTPYLRVIHDEVLQPDGLPGTYTYVDVPNPVVVVAAVTDDAGIHLVRQWRYPWRRNSWELPAGHCEPGESLEEGARRELAEEVQLAAGRVELLGSWFSGAALTARYHLFLARDLSPAQHRATRDGGEADMISAVVPLATAVAAAAEGTIEHSLSALGLLRIAWHLGLRATGR